MWPRLRIIRLVSFLVATNGNMQMTNCLRRHTELFRDIYGKKTAGGYIKNEKRVKKIVRYMGDNNGRKTRSYVILYFRHYVFLQLKKKKSIYKIIISNEIRRIPPI